MRSHAFGGPLGSLECAVNDSIVRGKVDTAPVTVEAVYLAHSSCFGQHDHQRHVAKVGYDRLQLARNLVNQASVRHKFFHGFKHGM